MSKHFVILGAGISGLATAWYLQKHFGTSIKISIIEKSHRIGGWIQTLDTDGFLFEQGPHSCRSYGAGINTLELVEELGLQNEVIAADPSAKWRYLYVDKQLQKCPSNFMQALFSPLTKGIIKSLWRDWNIPNQSRENESIYDFFSRRLDGHLVDNFIDPFISGIYAGDMHKLSLQACFPNLYEMEKEYGSLVKGMFLKKKQKERSISFFVQKIKQAHLFSFKKGMETLPKAIADKLNAEIFLNTVLKSLVDDQNGITLTLSNGSRLNADYVISTLPYPALNNILNFDEKFNLPYASVTVVSLGYDKPVLKKKGFGYLVPHKEQEGILGCIWDSSVFPQQNRNINETRLTVMLGGARNKQENNEECLEKALKAVKKHLHIDALPIASSVQLAHQAIPQYELGYLRFKEQFMRKIPSRLILAGQTFNGISVNDNIKAAKDLVMKLSQ